jgi:hypothetical protein
MSCAGHRNEMERPANGDSFTSGRHPSQRSKVLQLAARRARSEISIDGSFPFTRESSLRPIAKEREAQACEHRSRSDWPQSAWFLKKAFALFGRPN